MKLLQVSLWSILWIPSMYAQQNKLDISTGDTSNSISIKTLYLSARVFGNQSLTTWTMVLENHSNKILEANLSFPLTESAQITGYALDMNGVLRKAVPVPKAKGAQILEAIENKNVDPGLIEKIDGNVFRTRVYPINALGQRTVQIEYQEALPIHQGSIVYSLPFYYDQEIEEMNIDVRFINPDSEPSIQSQMQDMIKFDREGSDFIIRKSISNVHYTYAPLISVRLKDMKTQVLTEDKDGQHYFLVNTFHEHQKISKKKPQKISLLWDNSLSGQERNHKQEFELLDAYFRYLKNVQVQLIVFNYQVQMNQIIQVANGNWSQLKSKLTSLSYDGATQFGAIDLKAEATDEYLLFSDGHQTYFRDQMNIRKGIPLYGINTSAKADFSNLVYMSNTSSGQMINLLHTSVEDALEELKFQNLQFLGIGEGSSAYEVYPASASSGGQVISIAGKFMKQMDELTLLFGYGKTVTTKERIKLINDRSINIKRNKKSSTNQEENKSGMELSIKNNGQHIFPVSRSWAQKKIETLEQQFEKNAVEISKLGQQFGLVTRGTSLIVLENVEDYVRFEIEPPIELREAYRSLNKTKRAQLLDQKKSFVEPANDMMGILHQWWNTSNNRKKTKLLENYSIDAASNTNGSVESVVTGNQNTAGYASAPPPPRPPTNRISSESVEQRREETILQKDVVISNQLKAEETSDLEYSIQRSAAPVQSQEEDRLLFDKAAPLEAAKEAEQVPLHQNASVQEHPELFKGNDPGYMHIIKKTPESLQYKKYLELRESYIKVPVFYYLIGSYFMKTNRREIGMKVLSNIAELDYENYEMYKMLGYKLKEIGAYQEEASVFKKIVAWRPNDPQSYRDYALSLMDAGDMNEAFIQLKKAFENSYDENANQIYEGIEEVLLMDAKMLVRKCPAHVVAKNYFMKWMKALPVDIRVVLNWNMIDTDIDLWVTDPDQEVCKYDHKETNQGGRISNDFTDGFGPEQFMLKKAKKGIYKIEADYYGQSQVKIAGQTTIMAEIYTHEGTPFEKRQIVSFQLEEGEERTRLVATFKM